MSQNDLPKGYEPQDVEERWRDFWDQHQSFTPDLDATGDAYSIVIPPPNVTGSLHIGHALNITLQDILCRYQRQKGKRVLWVPGMDHAGIATQNVVERQLAKEGKSRHDLGREAFIERVWQWKEEYGGRILKQIRGMGASVDWSRQRFTLDEGLSQAVREVFVSLYEQNLVYKGEYIINWCNRCHTALADDEVEHANRKGHIWHIRYPLEKPVNGIDSVIVATTRPETMLGDSAVAVHPEDERYTAIIGATVVLPLLGRKIPVIGDTYVEREFGTGCLKVTPAHDMNDWELGRTHQLDVIQVIDEDGKMNELAGSQYQGLTKEECRKRVLEDLEKLGLLVEAKDYEHSVGHCYRCKSVIEPHVSTQWFVSMKPLAEKARAAVPDQTRILPESWAKTYYHWLDNIRDWCISRQLWWGHRIPAWTCEECGELTVTREDPETCCKCGSSKLVQDEDVLDTWFSSALWPFSTLGWPNETRELEIFYPTSVLVTAFDILFFWVARMMMMGLQFRGEIPFHDVYIHALVRDAEGKKMSKSTGNVIDPMDMVAKYGTDSLRFTLAAFAAMGRDIKLSEDRIEGYRHFVNKIWNASRFALMHLPGKDEAAPVAPEVGPAEQGLHHAWICHRLDELAEELDASLTAYRFNDAAQALYRFIWMEFCDWYLEMLKPELSGDDAKVKNDAQYRMLFVLKRLLVLLHPYMPFVSSEIWSYLPGIEQEDLSKMPYPESVPGHHNPEAAQKMELLQQTIVSVRNIRGELNIAPSVQLTALIRTNDATEQAFFLEHQGMIKLLARVGTFEAAPEVSAPKASASAVVGSSELFVPLAGAVDFDAELARLDKELTKIAKELTAVNKKLANEGFTSKAPAEVVQKERDKAETLDEKQTTLTRLQERLKQAMQDI